MIIFKLVALPLYGKFIILAILLYVSFRSFATIYVSWYDWKEYKKAESRYGWIPYY